MGFIKYLFKHLRTYLNRWWYNEGGIFIASVFYIIIVGLAIWGDSFLSEKIQLIIYIGIVMVIGLIILAVIIWSITSWFMEQYDKYQEGK